jgi:adenine/guanine phosphoribosyltransferase-like PRPP-binding protein
MRVFLSHPSTLKPLIREVRGGLPRFVDSWLDEDSLCWGKSLSGSISTEIISATDFVVLFVGSAAPTDWVARGIEWALEREAQLDRPFLLPILVPPYAAEQHLQSLGDRLQLRLADYRKGSVDALASQLASKLFQLVAESFDKQNATSDDLDKPSLQDKVSRLGSALQESFVPNIIVGVPRGGLVVAALLSKWLAPRPTIPVISLWPRPEFDNSFNHIAPEAWGVPAADGITNVLIVDDICRSGDTLHRARTYLEGHLSPGAFKIETAALAYYEGQYADAIPPKFCVDRPQEAIRDVSGELELIFD